MTAIKGDLSIVNFFVIIIDFISVKSQQKEYDERSDDDQRIVGGEEAAVQNYPFQAFLILFRGNTTLQCGGSILSRFHIMTAAHCLEKWVSKWWLLYNIFKFYIVGESKE